MLGVGHRARLLAEVHFLDIIPGSGLMQLQEQPMSGKYHHLDYQGGAVYHLTALP